jgi:hypothetical protein
MGAFVDKTVLIRAIFEDTNAVLITAPSHFGKSTDLNMLKHFLEIQVKKNGEPIRPIENSPLCYLWTVN